MRSASGAPAATAPFLPQLPLASSSICTELPCRCLPLFAAPPLPAPFSERCRFELPPSCTPAPTHLPCPRWKKSAPSNFPSCCPLPRNDEQAPDSSPDPGVLISQTSAGFPPVQSAAVPPLQPLPAGVSQSRGMTSLSWLRLSGSVFINACARPAPGLAVERRREAGLLVCAVGRERGLPAAAGCTTDAARWERLKMEAMPPLPAPTRGAGPPPAPPAGRSGSSPPRAVGE